MAIIRYRDGAIPDPWVGRVRKVFDGDTLAIDGGAVLAVVRLWGIDAPEWGQTGAGAAWRKLRVMAGQGPVYVAPSGLDRFGRVVGACSTHEIGDFGLSLLKAGLVWWEFRFAPLEIQYREAQAAARLEHVGLWLMKPYGWAPWVWRRQRHGFR